MTRRDSDLEIVLQWRQDAQFDVSLAYDDPSSPADRRDLVRDPVVIDTDALALLTDDNDAYGAELSRMLFAPDEVRTFYAQARAVADARGIPMHLRLLVSPRAPRRFQTLRWESLRDPVDGQPIATRRNVLLSRYLSSGDWSNVAPPPRHDLRALVVIANPSDLANFRPAGRALPPVDVEDEQHRARTALAGMQAVVLAAGGSATLAAITDALEQDVDVLYLVCHGALVGDEPRLFLEQPDGTTDPVDGAKLAKQVAGLSHRPTLAVLCSCQSAGNGEQAWTTDEGALSALGPRLAAAGVAAVIGMQGNVTMRTDGRFLSWPSHGPPSARNPTGGCRCCSRDCAAGARTTNPPSRKAVTGRSLLSCHRSATVPARRCSARRSLRHCFLPGRRSPGTGRTDGRCPSPATPGETWRRWLSTCACGRHLRHRAPSSAASC
jgi:hypothetical protein